MYVHSISSTHTHNSGHLLEIRNAHYSVLDILLLSVDVFLCMCGFLTFVYTGYTSESYVICYYWDMLQAFSFNTHSCINLDFYYYMLFAKILWKGTSLNQYSAQSIALTTKRISLVIALPRKMDLMDYILYNFMDYTKF